MTNMAASRTTDFTLCSCAFSFSLSFSGLSFDRTGMARLATGDNLCRQNQTREKMSTDSTAIYK